MKIIKEIVKLSVLSVLATGCLIVAFFYAKNPTKMSNPELPFSSFTIEQKDTSIDAMKSFFSEQISPLIEDANKKKPLRYLVWVGGKTSGSWKSSLAPIK
ncbi:MAG: hypothetical protein ACP5I1_19260 [Candidatus Hinthialibacter sp.]